jgi:hypothetical protein
VNEEQAQRVARDTLAQDNVRQFKPRVFDQERDDPDSTEQRSVSASALEWSVIVTALEHHESEVVRLLGEALRDRLTAGRVPSTRATGTGVPRDPPCRGPRRRGGGRWSRWRLLVRGVRRRRPRPDVLGHLCGGDRPR